MTHLVLTTLATATSVEWNPNVGLTMIICNILAIALGKATMKDISAEPAMPSPQFFGGMGLPAVLATTSFGHVLGIGAILGLASMGVL
ncbi:MAG: photosystem I reaction center subunit PsaK [Coleofasciculaceae cyanobacterium RL_1_1]|nr:photosystem I reaction center subunit PsaK [Coleofasciculaceae cyanobacterium RL_1_1]